MSQSQGEAAAIRWAGALMALAGASSLLAMDFLEVEARAHVVLALHAMLLLGCAAVLVSPAHGAVSDLARRATEAARRTTAALGAPSGSLLRWLGFAGIVLYALYVTGDVVAARKEATAQAEADTVKAFLLFLMFLVGVSAVYLSMIRERGGPPRPSATAAAEPEASLDRAGVYLPTVATMDTGKGGPLPRPPAAAAEKDHDGGEVNGPVCVVVVDTKL